jgi:Rad3-related DNA helicase
MSATILSPDTVRYSLGIDKNNSTAFRSNSRFCKENRPIYVTDVGPMSFKKKLETLPKLLLKVEEVMDHYSTEKGIIHTHTFEIANYIYNNINHKHRNRLIYQKNFNRREEVIEEHKRQKNSVIIAPAMNEGLNLNDDLSRFAIICKVPYPSFKDDEQLKIRMEESQDYYIWLTACSLVQAYGRSVRSETDWAHTYILDSDFYRFYKDAEKMLPSWFKEAVIKS